MPSQPIKHSRGYRVRWRFQGQWQQVVEPSFDDARLAHTWLRNVVHDQIADTDPRIVGKAYLYGQTHALAVAATTWPKVVVEYLDLRVDTGKLSPDTRRAYEQSLDLHTAHWVDRPVAHLGVDDLNGLYRTLTGPRALRATSAIVVMMRVRSVLRFAKAKGYTDFSVTDARALLCFTTTLPGKVRKRPHLSAAAITAMLAAAPTPQDALMLRVAFTLGLRIGELCALNVGDVDAANGVLWVQARMIGGQRRAGTKGSRPDRILAAPVALDDGLLAALVSFIGDRPADGPLFVSRRGTYMRPATWRRHVWRRIVATIVDAGHLSATEAVMATPHIARHVMVTMFAAVAPLTVAQGRARHGQLATTAGYANALDPVVMAEQRRVANLLYGKGYAA